MDDARTLTAAIAAGDGAAFARLYDARFDMMYASARRFTGKDEQDCLDVVQDAMLRVIRAARVIDDWPSLDAWLRCVVRSAAYDHLRRERRRRARERAVSEHRAEPDPRAPDAAGLALAERMAWLREELATADPDAARLLSLRFRAGLTLERIGETLGVGPGAADGRIRRTLAAMRERAPKEEQ